MSLCILVCVCDPLKEHGCKHSSQTFYTQHILDVIIIIAMIKENDNYKVVLFSVTHFFYCYLFLK